MSKKEIKEIEEQRSEWKFEADFWDLCRKHPNLPIRSLIHSLSGIIARLAKELK